MRSHQLVAGACSKRCCWRRVGKLVPATKPMARQGRPAASQASSASGASTAVSFASTASENHSPAARQRLPQVGSPPPTALRPAAARIHCAPACSARRIPDRARWHAVAASRDLQIGYPRRRVETRPAGRERPRPASIAVASPERRVPPADLPPCRPDRPSPVADARSRGVECGMRLPRSEAIIACSRGRSTPASSQK